MRRPLDPVRDPPTAPVVRSPARRVHDIPASVLEAVTRYPGKASLYGIDNYFRESCWTFGEALDDVLPVALCMLTPDAAAGRRYRTALDALLGNGFRPVDVLRFRHDRLTVRESWRYELHRVTRQRLDALDLLLPAADSVLLVVTDRRWSPGGPPAAVRLAALAGPAGPGPARPGRLRERLGVTNALFAFLHVCDEPADVMRQLSVLTAPGRRELVRERIRCGHDALAESRAAFDQLEAEVPSHDLGLEPSWRRLAACPGRAGELARLWHEGGHVAADDVIGLARSGEAPPAHRWDLLSVLAHSAEIAVPDARAIFPGPVRHAWGPSRTEEVAPS